MDTDFFFSVLLLSILLSFLNVTFLFEIYTRFIRRGKIYAHFPTWKGTKKVRKYFLVLCLIGFSNIIFFLIIISVLHACSILPHGKLEIIIMAIIVCFSAVFYEKIVPYFIRKHEKTDKKNSCIE